MHSRREFIGSGLAACALAWSLAGCSSRDARVWRIGYLWPTEIEGTTTPVKMLRAGLGELGYAEGRNLQLEIRVANGDLQRLAPLARELVAAKVDVIVAASPPAILAASGATREIPIVMAAWGGPGLLESGIVATLARPGGNVTGIDMLSEELNAKRLETLIEAVPGARRIAVLDSGVIGGPAFEALRPVAARNKVDLVLSAVPAPRDYAPVFGKMSSDGIDALLVPTSTRFYREQAEIIAAAAAFRMPTMYEWGDMARNGGLIGYGPDLKELVRRCVSFIDRILKGAKPGTLPVEQPREYELVINAKTAEALPLALPQELLRRANDVVR